MKKATFLLIILVLTLSLTAATLTQISNVKADTSEVKVLSYSYYTAPANTPTMASAIGDLIVVGELKNVGSNIVGNVTVEGTAFSSSGQLLATTLSEAFVYKMAPGQKAPFYIDFTAQSSTSGDLTWISKVGNVSVTVTAVTDDPVPPYTGIKFITNPPSNLSDPVSGIYLVTGTVQNQGNQNVSKFWAVTTFYDAAGKVVGVNFTQYLIPYPSPFKPGDYSLFGATPSDSTPQLVSQISDFSVIIDAIVSLSPTPNASNSASPTATTNVATPAFPTLPVIVIVVLVVAAVLGLLLFSRHQKTPPPPPPPPE